MGSQFLIQCRKWRLRAVPAMIDSIFNILVAYRKDLMHRSVRRRARRCMAGIALWMLYKNNMRGQEFK